MLRAWVSGSHYIKGAHCTCKDILHVQHDSWRSDHYHSAKCWEPCTKWCSTHPIRPESPVNCC